MSGARRRSREHAYVSIMRVATMAAPTTTTYSGKTRRVMGPGASEFVMIIAARRTGPRRARPISSANGTLRANHSHWLVPEACTTVSISDFNQSVFRLIPGPRNFQRFRYWTRLDSCNKGEIIGTKKTGSDMIFSEHSPSAPLNTYIKALRYSEGPTLYQHLKMLPGPALNLMINFDGAFNCYKAEDAKPSATYTESWSIGLWNTHHVLDWPQNMQLFVVDFKPGGAYPFLHLPLSELHNDIVSLDAIWGNLAAEIHERLYSAPTIQSRFALLEQLLLARLGEVPDGLRAVRYAVAEMARHHGSLSIRDLGEEVGMSHNHLTRQFQRLVGGTPKELARIYRFRYALSNLDHSQPIDWSEVASQARFYDQAHFNKDFKAFTGHTPTDFLRLHRQVHIDTPTLPPNFLPTG